MIIRAESIQPSWICKVCHEDKPVAAYTYVQGGNHQGLRDIETCKVCKKWLRTETGIAWQIDCAKILGIE